MSPRRLKLLMLLAAAALALFAAPGFMAYNYMEHNPKFCTSCHVMNDAYGRWGGSEHSKIECHSCHISSMAGNVKRLYFAVFNPKEKVESHAEVNRTVCQKCHESKGGKRWQAVLATAGHRLHMERPNAQCVDCHSESVHRFTPPAQVCLKCHKKVALHEKGMKDLECLGCHDYLAPASERVGLLPSASDCRRCHSGEDLAKGISTSSSAAEASSPPPPLVRLNGQILPPGPSDVPHTIKARDRAGVTDTSTAVTLARAISKKWLHGGLDCRSCHNPHREELTVRRSGTICARCHRGNFDQALRPTGHTSCRACHQPHGPRDAAIEACKGCHEGRHALAHKDRCTICHKPHAFKADGEDCRACHSDIALKLFNDAPKPHDKCQGCHSPHAPKPDSAVCAKCHKREGQKAIFAAGTPDKHRICVSCHTQHGKKPGPSEPCAKCHTREIELASTSEVLKHRDCRSCHATIHGPPEKAPAACVRCHSKQGSLVASAAKAPDPHKICSSCHQPHAQSPVATRDSCGKCHREELASTADGGHRGACAACHNPHGQPVIKQGSCAGCHVKVKLIPGRGGVNHGTCQNCHQPHRALSAVVERCEKCHADKKKSLLVWAKAEPHQKCASCHVGHEAGKPKPCGSCHAAEARGLEQGKHEKCSGCHRPHQTLEASKPAFWKECARCHKTEVDNASARGPTHSRCGECHLPHSFKKPNCTDCHSAIRSVLMHQVQAHQDCKKCHDAHKDAKPTRATCQACHSNKKDHYPEVGKCNSCHPFSGGAGTPMLVTPIPKKPASE